jgi:hypothetical protein
MTWQEALRLRSNVKTVLVRTQAAMPGWSVNPDATGAGYVAPGPTHSADTTAHGNVGAGSDSSIERSDSEQWPSGGQRGVVDPVPPTQAVSTVTRHGMGADDNASLDQSDSP